ncbi:hypothetical protein C0Q70_00681, partial [Pomacea canaliculata]
VRCGSVYVSSEDSTQAVTQTVVTATSVAEKKRRASKYTVAIGTSHGHVQAFLEDADSVLSALDQCQAEEKCLMLIKRPKDTARKMLKSHSWANLSVSEPQLFRQFNGVSLGQTEPVTHQPYMMRRSSDQQSVTSCETDRSDGRRRYVTARGKENLRRQGQRSLSDSTNDNYQLLSDATSVACDYHADRKGERIREHSRLAWTLLKRLCRATVTPTGVGKAARDKLRIKGCKGRVSASTSRLNDKLSTEFTTLVTSTMGPGHSR